ncbi:MAG TPA: universal stress protein [Pirellulaceae bacterium]|jgi:nucleotide-binding universal stress UspA family protein|nr:universal stress protein [Pirellulaceae bacterium]
MSSFSNILVHVDTRAETNPGLDYAADLAKTNDARLKIVDVIPDFSWPVRLATARYERVIENLTQSKTQRLIELATPIEQQGVAVQTKLVEGRSSVEIVREVLRDKHDLVIRSAKGTHSRRSGFFGTTATRLIRKCPCPVLILKAGQQCRCERVVAAVNATSDDELHAKLNEQIIRLAREMTTGGEPAVVDVWSIYGESILKSHMQEDEFQDLEERTEKHAEQLLAQLLTPFDIAVGGDNVHLLRGEAGAVIPKLVEKLDADLLVMGTVARAGVAGLLIGNTAEQILDRVECSVLAVKPDDFVSPIRLSS